VGLDPARDFALKHVGQPHPTAHLFSVADASKTTVFEIVAVVSVGNCRRNTLRVGGMLGKPAASYAKFLMSRGPGRPRADA
jgi:hypothetical protein